MQGNGVSIIFLNKTLSCEQLQAASKIIKQERQKYSNREQEDEAAEAKALELVTALKNCRTESKKEEVLRLL